MFAPVMGTAARTSSRSRSNSNATVRNGNGNNNSNNYSNHNICPVYDSRINNRYFGLE